MPSLDSGPNLWVPLVLVWARAYVELFRLALLGNDVCGLPIGDGLVRVDTHDTTQSVKIVLRGTYKLQFRKPFIHTLRWI